MSLYVNTIQFITSNDLKGNSFDGNICNHSNNKNPKQEKKNNKKPKYNPNKKSNKPQFKGNNPNNIKPKEKSLLRKILGLGIF